MKQWDYYQSLLAFYWISNKLLKIFHHSLWCCLQETFINWVTAAPSDVLVGESEKGLFQYGRWNKDYKQALNILKVKILRKKSIINKN